MRTCAHSATTASSWHISAAVCELQPTSLCSSVSDPAQAMLVHALEAESFCTWLRRLPQSTVELSSRKQASATHRSTSSAYRVLALVPHQEPRHSVYEAIQDLSDIHSSSGSGSPFQISAGLLRCAVAAGALPAMVSHEPHLLYLCLQQPPLDAPACLLLQSQYIASVDRLQPSSKAHSCSVYTAAWLRTLTAGNATQLTSGMSAHVHTWQCIAAANTCLRRWSWACRACASRSRRPALGCQKLSLTVRRWSWACRARASRCRRP